MTEQEFRTILLGVSEKLRADLQASHCLFVLGNMNIQKILPSVFTASEYDIFVATRCLQNGLSQNHPALEGLGDGLCLQFGATHYLILLYYQGSDEIICSRNCTEQLWRLMLERLWLLPANTATIH